MCRSTKSKEPKHETSQVNGVYVIAAGGTGGHIFPGIALAREIRARRPEAEVLFVGSRHGLESKLVPQAGFPLELVRVSGFAGKSAVAKLLALAELPAGFFQARRILTERRARAVAGVGGYVTVPVVAAARSLGVPTLIHESNAYPGVANRLLNRIATRAAVGVATANSRLWRPGVVTGTPVRPEFFSVTPLDPSAATRRLLVFGGSQGSRVLNRAMAEAVALLAAERGLEVIHQTGEGQLEDTRARYGEPPAGWRLVPFLPRIHEELGWADLVLARAGSQTLAELAAAGRPSILVPFGSATHAHQRENARVFSTAGASLTIDESSLSGEALARTIGDLLGDRARLVAMGENARGFARPEAAKALADLLFDAEGK
jgi:UDP-N-acetylglucosamine--N-acetylmuramyl-(pentapeptide) pyrophosphoryl-undecaprenol N-acetylglucosamine transferase